MRTPAKPRPASDSAARWSPSSTPEWHTTTWVWTVPSSPCPPSVSVLFHALSYPQLILHSGWTWLMWIGRRSWRSNGRSRFCIRRLILSSGLLFRKGGFRCNFWGEILIFGWNCLPSIGGIVRVFQLNLDSRIFQRTIIVRSEVNLYL